MDIKPDILDYSTKFRKVSWKDLTEKQKNKIQNYLKSQSGLEKTIDTDITLVKGYAYDTIFFYGN